MQTTQFKKGCSKPKLAESAIADDLPKKIADLRTCGLWQLKLRTCGYGLFLILGHIFEAFIQILKLPSNFVKYFCFNYLNMTILNEALITISTI